MRQKQIDVDTYTILNVQVKRKEGTIGSLFIVYVSLESQNEILRTVLALKFVETGDVVKKELKNALLLEHHFKTFPKYGIPKIIFASTKDPALIVYEGVPGVNYDEITDLPVKPYEAGRLLAIIHGTTLHKISSDHYKHYVQKICETLRDIPFEREIMKLVSPIYDSLNKNMEGSPIFADFHQSNVMINYFKTTVHKSYIIDPEWYNPTEIFSRFEDIGTFFGKQAFLEWLKTKKYENVRHDILLFLKGYQEQLISMNGPHLKQIAPTSVFLEFYVALWSLLDSLDVLSISNQQKAMEEHALRKQFALHILQNRPFTNVVSKAFLK